MSNTGIDVFDTTLHKTTLWLNDLMTQMGWQDRHQAYSILRAVLHTLRDRLIVDEAVNLGAQLPMLIRGFYYEGWHPADKPLKYRHKKDFMQHVAEHFREFDEAEQDKVVGAVFRVLNHHLAEGTIDKIKQELPAELREFWPTSG